MPALKAAASDESPFGGKNAPRKARDVHWLKPELVAEIEFAGWTGDGNIRQAAFKGLRQDKPARRGEGGDAGDDQRWRNRPQRRPRSNRGSRLRRGETEASNAEVMGVVISHPDKAMWPDAGDGEAVTKLDLARYFEAVGDWMIAYLKGRPCSIVRAPDGIKGEQFFQRHAHAGHLEADWSWSRSPATASPICRSTASKALAAVAQLGGLELHPWNCAPGEYDVPGRLVFDLDPAPDVEFAEVIDAAKAMRQRLSGARHGELLQDHRRQGPACRRAAAFMAPGTGSTWKEAKAFAQGVCQLMASEDPERYLLNMSKKRSARERSSSTICATTGCRPRSPCCRRARAPAPRSRCR